MFKKIAFLSLAATVLAFALGFVAPHAIANGAPLVTIETIPVGVGEPGNAADPATGYGAVNNAFNMGKYKVTITQYVAFLNAVATVPPNPVIKGLYKDEMGDIGEDSGVLIQRTGAGTDGDPYQYTVDTSTGWGQRSGDRPIPWVTWFDAARFANWMHNGALRGASTETGAYTLVNYQEQGAVARNQDAQFFIPSEDEWYKAAYYDPSKGGVNLYWNYPAKSDKPPRIDLASNNPLAPAANFQNVYIGNEAGVLTPVGAYCSSIDQTYNSASYYGTCDQGGLLWEWTEASYPNPLTGPNRIVRGGSWGPGITPLRKTIRRDYGPMAELPFYFDDDTGFRLATPFQIMR